MSVKLTNGLSVPAIGYGTWKLGKDIATDAVYTAIKTGYRHIDCAHIYGNEKEVGAGIKRAIDEGIVSRSDIWVTSKLWNDDHADVMGACQNTLNNLGLEYLDLYLIHWPTNWVKGSWPPVLAEGITNVTTWKGMEAVQQKGMTKSIGVSNYSAAQVQEIIDNATVRPVINQVEAHPYWNQFKLEAALKPMGVALTAYSPFNQNAADKLDPVQERHSLFDAPEVVAAAAKHNKTAGQILLRWHVQLGRVVIPKTKTPARMAENLGALAFELDAEDMAALNAMKPQIRGLNPYSFDGVEGAPFFKD
jgi:diketogulonate reductase-like aldo/keto reductase